MGRAAERLNISQPALSQQIRLLEQSLDVVLFQRNGRRLSATLAAQTLYSHAVPLLGGMERAHDAMRTFGGQAPRTLAIGVLQTVNASLVPLLLDRLRQAQPQMVVQIYELSGLDIERRLLAGSLDVGIGFLPPRQSGLQTLDLYEDELQLVVGEQHPLREFRKVSLAQAAELPMVLLGEEYRVRQIWQEQLAIIGRRPRVEAELNHMSTILDSLRQSTLGTVLPSRARKMEQEGALLWKPISEPRIPLRVGLVYRDAQRQRTVLEILKSVLDTPQDT